MALLTLSLILSTGIIGGLTAIVAFGNIKETTCVLLAAYITAVIGGFLYHNPTLGGLMECYFRSHKAWVYEIAC